MKSGDKNYQKKEMITPVEKSGSVQIETEELIAIVAKSVNTAKGSNKLQSLIEYLVLIIDY